jgi:predicted HTH domain antitoxin
MSVRLEIPHSVAQAIRLPEEELVREPLEEIAVALYARGVLSFGKAEELAGMGKYEFARLLNER